MEEFEAALRDPKVIATLERARRLAGSNIQYMTEVAPNLFVVDHHLARRAQMHVVEDDPTQS
jgi:hypothetical protein